MTPTDTRTPLVLKAMQNAAPMQSKDIAAKCGITPRQAGDSLGKLKRQGHVINSPGPRGKGYFWRIGQAMPKKEREGVCKVEVLAIFPVASSSALTVVEVSMPKLLWRRDLREIEAVGA